MRKLPDWLLQEQATLEASKSHHYLQMNLHTLRHFLGKMKQTTPAFKAKTSSWMRLVYFLTLAILITTAHHTIQLWILGILLLLHIAMLPGETLLHLFKVLVKVLLFSTIVILPSILFQGFQNGGLFLLRAGDDCPQYFSLFSHYHKHPTGGGPKAVACPKDLCPDH